MYPFSLSFDPDIFDLEQLVYVLGAPAVAAALSPFIEPELSHVVEEALYMFEH